MEGELLHRIVALAGLLVLSAYFSGSESAFFSLSRLEQDGLRQRAAPRLRRIIERILSSPEEVLITILTGNMLVNVFASSMAEAIGRRLFGRSSELLSIVSMTILLLLGGEMMPKNVAVRYAVGFARASAYPLYGLFVVFKPLRWFLNLFNRLVNALFPLRQGAREGRPNIILSAVNIGFREGILNRSELTLMESFVEFRDRTAEEVMIPRTEVTGVEVSTPIAEVLRLGPSLLPVYSQDMDHLLGYVTPRDLLPYRYGLRQGENLAEVLRPFVSVPFSKNCARLLVEMRESNTEMALVVDEYGGTAGIITFRKLMSELLGYFFPSADGEPQSLGPEHYRLPGAYRVEDLAELFDLQLESESHTVAGLVTEQLGEIPAEGARVVVGGLELTVRRVVRNRILEVEARRQVQ